MSPRHLSALAIVGLLLAASTGAARAETFPVPPVPATGQSRAGAPPVRKAAFHERRAQPLASDVYGGSAAIPARQAQPQFSPAPTPDDEFAPSRRDPLSIDTEPKLFTVKTQFRGDGYPYGATSQGLDDKEEVKVPGVNVRFPLVQ